MHIHPWVVYFSTSRDWLIWSVFPRPRQQIRPVITDSQCESAGFKPKHPRCFHRQRPPVSADVSPPPTGWTDCCRNRWMTEWNLHPLRLSSARLHPTRRRPARSSWGGIRGKAAVVPRNGRRTRRRLRDAPPTCWLGSSPPWPDSWEGLWPGAAPEEGEAPDPIFRWNSRIRDRSFLASPRMRSSARRTT